jgi:hypothetical protein
MSFINYASREINYKVVYTGRACAGRRRTPVHLRRPIRAQGQDDLAQTETERTLFFDCRSRSARSAAKTRFHLYTVPGQSSTTRAAS